MIVFNSLCRLINLLLISTLLIVGIYQSTYAQVRKTYNGDTLIGNVKKVIEYDNRGEFIVKRVYRGHPLLHTQIANFYQGDSHFLKATWVLKYDNANQILENSLYAGVDSLCEAKFYQYDDSGKIIERRIVNDYCDNCVRLTSWLINGMYSYNQGIHTITTQYKYDIRGKLETEKKEQIIAIEHSRDTNVTITVYKYDGKGNEIAIRKESWYSDSSVDLTLKKYTSDNRLSEKRELRFDLNKKDTDITIHMVTYMYDNNGNIIEEREYSNQSVFQDSGRNKMILLTIYTYKYDQLDNLIDSRVYYENKIRHYVMINYSGGKGANCIGSGTLHYYDNLNNEKFYSNYKLYKEDDSTEKVVISDTVQVNKVRPMSKKEKINTEYDQYGNVIKQWNDSAILLRREIEYYE